LTFPPDDRDDAREVDDLMARIAEETGGTLHIYPRPGQAVRRVVLRDERTGADTRHLAAQVETDGTVRITGHDQGPGVSAVFGSDITSYEWVYVVAPDRVDALAEALAAALGGAPAGDVLDLLAAHVARGGLLDPVLRSPAVAAHFDNWPS
jgi:hypothetical protein